MNDMRLTDEKERSPCLGHENNNVDKSRSPRRLVTLDILMACWGLAGWIGVNGLFVQMPLLVRQLPEYWKLATMMAVAVQVANVGPLLYGAARRLHLPFLEWHYIYGLLTLGAAALFLNAFLYDATVPILGEERSFAFLMLTACSALVGCTGSVLFYPYLRHFRDIYLATYLAGEGLSGLLPSALALVQGFGGEPDCVPIANSTKLTPVYPPPRFSTTVFLLIICALVVLSLLSFAALHNCSWFDSERVTPSAAAKAEEANTAPVSLTSARWMIALGLVCILNALSNGVLPSVQAYSCMPYGALAYHLSATLGAMAAPAACLAGVWLRPLPLRVLAGALVAALPLLAYILATALLSPRPPLLNTSGGIVLIVACWVSVTGALAYARMWAFGWARGGGERGMRAAGAATQTGSAAGSLLLFVLVNYTTLFTQKQDCAPVAS